MNRSCPRRIRSRRTLARFAAAIGFVGCVLFAGQGKLLADDAALSAFCAHVLALLESFEPSSETDAVAKAVASAATFRDVDVATAPLTLAKVGINPEARVKIGSAPERVDLVAGQPRRFLVRVENLAGVTAPLRLRGLDMASPDGGEASWLRLRAVDAASNEPSLASVELSGTTEEYVAVELLVSEPGVREIRLVADAGQGTQDLGFRATADVQVRTSSASPTP